jgi:DNA-binding IclR family transcriptional regulator
LRRQLGRIAAAGVAYEFEESTPGLVCVAAPVREADRVVAAISVAGPSNRFHPEAHAAAVRAAADGIGVTLTRRARMVSSCGA